MRGDGQVLQRLFVKPSAGESKTKLKQFFGLSGSKISPTTSRDYFPISDCHTELDVEHDTVSDPDALWHVPPKKSQYPGLAPRSWSAQSRPQSRSPSGSHSGSHPGSQSRVSSTVPTSPEIGVPSPRGYGNIRNLSTSQLDPMTMDNSAWDAGSISTTVIDDYENESWEPDMQMEEIDIPMVRQQSQKWPNQFKKLLVRGSRYEIHELDETDSKYEAPNSPNSFNSPNSWWRPNHSSPRIEELTSSSSRKLTPHGLECKQLVRKNGQSRPGSKNASRVASRGGSRVVSGTLPPADMVLKGFPPIESALALCREYSRKIVLFKPLERLADLSPQMEVPVVIAELLIIMYLLYQLSILIETLALAIRSLCLPLIIVGKVLGYL